MVPKLLLQPIPGDSTLRQRTDSAIIFSIKLS
jgi:hypothetical protein